MQAKNRGKGISCIGNMGQLCKAECSYSTDYGFHMPSWGTDVSMGGTGNYWAGYFTKTGATYDFTGATGGFINPYVAFNWKVLCCPSWPLKIDDRGKSRTEPG
jgi:hypothetical protein